MKRALFRFDVTPQIGAGHKARCLALADELEQRGHRIVCAVNRDGCSFLPALLATSAVPVAPGELPDTGVIGRFDLAIVDHYGLAAHHEEQLRACADRIVVVDDLANRRHDADILIDTAPGQRTDRYSALSGKSVLRLLGGDYALLREEFRQRRSDQRSPQAGQSPPRLLVSLGATDPDNVTGTVIRAIAQIPELGSITIVLGAGAPHAADVDQQVATLGPRARLLRNVTTMADLLRDHDIAIGAPGTSALERACMGIPQVLIETAPNQATVAEGLQRLGAAIRLGAAPDVDPTAIRISAAELAADRPRRQRMGAAGAIAVDGRGAARVAALLTSSPRDKSGTPLSARRIRQSDAATLLAWQSEASTRKYFRNPAPPSRSDHHVFMAARLTDDFGVCEVMELGSEPAAVVRADPDLRQDGYEVSVVVAPRFRGFGIGQAALCYLASLLDRTPLRAVVDPRNQPSISAFRRAGFGASGRLRLDVETMHPT